MQQDLKPYLPPEEIVDQSETGPYAGYRFEASRYIKEKLGWTPWSGGEGRPGQQQIVDAYTLAIRQQLERKKFELGEINEDDLTVWQPGMTIQNRIRVEAGHSVGKTMLLSGLVNHFFDCFVPSIIYTFAPTWKQIHDLLWKEIKAARRGKGLPGRILDLELVQSDNHFANGVAATDAGGKGTERVQGQHGPYLMFICDEAEGIADYVPGAINSMASGGVVIVLLTANPRTRLSWFYRWRELSNVRSFRMSCLQHPNVVEGREVIPGAVRRDYVDSMIEEHCEVASEPSEDDHTFEIPWRPGVIYKPNAEFLFRVLGVAPANMADDTFIPVGRFEAACKRRAAENRPTTARLGIDAAGYGNDLGTIYVRHNGAIWRAATCSKPAGDQDPSDYFHKAKKAALALKSPTWRADRAAKRPEGVTSLHIRIDAGGGFGNGVYDLLKRDAELLDAFAGNDDQGQPNYQIHLVHFGGTPRDESAYADMATEMYAEAGESLKSLAVLSPPPTLEADLCDRHYEWINKAGVEVKKLAPKKVFRKEKGRSPDDGDGFVLAAGPDHLFIPPENTVEVLFSRPRGRGFA